MAAEESTDNLEFARQWLVGCSTRGKEMNGWVSLPQRFLDVLTIDGVKIVEAEYGRLLFSLAVKPHMLNNKDPPALDDSLIAGMVDVLGTAVGQSLGQRGQVGVSTDIHVSYMLISPKVGEEIEIESKLLMFGKVKGAMSVVFRHKTTGEVFAQGHHSKYVANLPALQPSVQISKL